MTDNLKVGSNVVIGKDGNIQSIPVATVMPTLDLIIPEGWLLCDGSAILKAEYADLFNIIGTTYNSGVVPSDSFMLPNLSENYFPASSNNSNAGLSTTHSHSVTATKYTPSAINVDHSHNNSGTYTFVASGSYHAHYAYGGSGNAGGTSSGAANRAVGADPRRGGATTHNHFGSGINFGVANEYVGHNHNSMPTFGVVSWYGNSSHSHEFPSQASMTFTSGANGSTGFSSVVADNLVLNSLGAYFIIKY